MFEVLELSLTVLDRIASVETKVRTRRKSLADQIARSAESIGLNIAEGRQRALRQGGAENPVDDANQGAFGDLQKMLGAFTALMTRAIVLWKLGALGLVLEVVTIDTFYGVMFAVLMLVTFIPALSLWLPALVIK